MATTNRPTRLLLMESPLSTRKFLRRAGYSVRVGVDNTTRFLVERIMTYNVFGCPDSSLNTHNEILASASREPAQFGSCGIWTKASYLNHSCVSNARRAFIGDMMVVRATRDLAANTELNFWYQIPDGVNFKKLQKKLKSWGFVCDCAMCNDARTTKAAVFAQREKLLTQLKQLCESSQPKFPSTERFERLLRALDATYVRPAADVPRLPLWDPQLLLVRIYILRNNVAKSLEWISNVLSTLGFAVVGMDPSSTSFEIKRWGMVIDHLEEIFLHARTAFDAAGSPGDSRRAEEYARVAYRIVVGENSSFQSVHMTKTGCYAESGFPCLQSGL
jgi:hypothetical protein